LKMLRKLKPKRKENLTCPKVNGSETKKKHSLKKEQGEKNGLQRVYPILMLLKRKNLLPRMLDIRQEELKECIKEHLKLRGEQMPLIKSNWQLRPITERSKCRTYLRLLNLRKSKPKNSE